MKLATEQINYMSARYSPQTHRKLQNNLKRRVARRRHANTLIYRHQNKLLSLENFYIKAPAAVWKAIMVTFISGVRLMASFISVTFAFIFTLLFMAFRSIFSLQCIRFNL